jgi:hypothetical protein
MALVIAVNQFRRAGSVLGLPNNKVYSVACCCIVDRDLRTRKSLYDRLRMCTARCGRHIRGP